MMEKNLVSKEAAQAKITLMILSDRNSTNLIYSHTDITINLPKVTGFTPYQSVLEAQKKANEIIEKYHNDKLIEIK
jgi:hypothetical protein